MGGEDSSVIVGAWVAIDDGRRSSVDGMWVEIGTCLEKTRERDVNLKRGEERGRYCSKERI